jgi:spermidine synthase
MDLNFQNFKIDTSHNSIDVRCHQGRLEFRSGDKALQSVIDLENPHHLKLKNLEYLVAVLLFIRDPQRILMLGTAAGSLLHFLRHHYPTSEITTVDIDTELIEQLLHREILPPADARLSYVDDDAARFITNCNQTYDLVLVDIFTGSRSPAWLLEKECIDNLHRLLSQQGALAYNLLINSEHDFKRFYRDLRLVFDGQTLCLPVEGYENTIAYGIHTPGPVRDMSMNISCATSLSEKLGIDLVQALSVIYNTNPTGHGVI